MNLKHELHNGDKTALAAIAVSILVGLYLYNYLPDQIASHWNIQGIADGFMDKLLFAVVFPLLMVVAYLVLSLLPRVSELKYEMELLHRQYSGFKAAIVTFLAYVYIIVLYSNTNFSPLHVSTPQLLFPGISVLLYYLGAAMPKLKRNHLVGIRTPWTIASDEVWEKTHKLGGKLFKALSIVVMLATLTAAGFSTWLVLVPIIAVAILLLVYSYAYSKKAVLKHNTKKLKKNTRKKKKK